MRKIFFLAFLAVGMIANAQTSTTTDTEEIKNNSGIDLGKGKDDNDHVTMHFSIGMNIPTDAPDGLDFAPGRSWEFNWTIAQYDYTPKNWNTTFSAGAGFDFREYTIRGHKTGFFKAGNLVGIGTCDPAYDDFSSSIYNVSVGMPLLVKQKFSKNFAISLGAQLNWNYYARIHNHVEQGDDEMDVSTKKIGQRPFTVDVLGIVHFSGIGIYCKYSPMSVLKKDRGPEFKSFAVGIYF